MRLIDADKLISLYREAAIVAECENVMVPVPVIIQNIEDMALEQPEPCEDAVSRTELLSAFPYDDEPTVTKSSLRMTINHLPSVTPKVKRGKWIDNCTCSQCAWHMEDDDTGSIWFVGFNFCPNCGADMRGADDALGRD